LVTFKSEFSSNLKKSHLMRIKLLILLLFSSSILKAQFKANAGADQSICIGDTLKVVGSGLSASDTGTYQWKDLTSNSVLSNTSLMKLKIISSATRNFELIVTKKTYLGTFISKDSLTLTVNSLPTFKYNGTAARCFDQGCINFTTSNTAVALPGNISGLRYFQKNKNPSWISNSSPYIYCIKLSNNQLSPFGFRDTFCYDYRDSNGCYNYECKPLRIYPNPIVQLNAAEACQANGPQELGKLISQPIATNRVSGIESFRVIEVPAGSGVDPNTIITQNNSVVPNIYTLDIGSKNEYKKQGNYMVEYCFKNPSTGCQRCDTSIIKVINLPKIEFDSIPPFCMNGAMVNLDSFVRDSFTGKRLSGGEWECVEYGGSRNTQNSQVKNAINNSVWLKQYFVPKTGSGQYLLKYTNNAGGCILSDSLGIIVNGLPQIQLDQFDTICNNSGIIQLTSNYAANDTNSIWFGKYVQGRYINTNAINLGSSPSTTEKIYFVYRSPTTFCSNIDSMYTTIVKRPQFKFDYTLQANTKYNVDFSIVDSNMNLGNQKWLWYFGNGDTSTQKYPKGVFYQDSGEYTAILSIDNGICASSDTVKFKLNKVISGINSIARIVNLFPNPTNGVLNINTPIAGEIKLFNMEGKLLLSRHVEAYQDNIINLSNYSEGVYFISIENNDQQYWAKVIRSK